MRFSDAFSIAAILMLPGTALSVSAQSAGSGASPVAQNAAGPATATDKLLDSIIVEKRVCRVWSVPSATSKFPKDASYNSCALDKAPALISSAAMPGAPRINRSVTANFVIVVNADGSVNRELTSFGGGLLHAEYLNAIQDSMSHWRFTPGMRGGIAVRSARSLRIESTGVRVDTITASLDWTYRANAGTDTLSGLWVVRAPLPQLTAAQTDSMYMTFLYQLALKRVMVANTFSNLQYCLVVQNGDSIAQTRITNRARYMGLNGRQYDPGIDTPPPFYFAGYACERSADPLRIILPPIRRSEEGKVEFNTGGDFLLNYPLGVNGRSWRGWKAHCAGAIPEHMPITLACEIDANRLIVEWIDSYREGELERAHAAKLKGPGGNDSTWITAIVTTSGAAQNDTLRAAIGLIPVLTEPLIDSLWPCGSVSTFITARDSSEAWLIHANPFGEPLSMSRVNKDPPRTSPRIGPCANGQGSASTFRAFLASGVNGKPSAPITMQYTTADRTFVVDPARYTILDQPHLKFRVSDLRAATRTGARLSVRLRVQTAQSGIVPVVVFPDLGYPWLSRAIAAAPGVWDFQEPSNHKADGLVSIYLIRRASPP